MFLVPHCSWLCGSVGQSPLGIWGSCTSKRMRAPWKVPCLLSKQISGVCPAASVHGSCQDVYFVWSEWVRRFPILEQEQQKVNFIYFPKIIRFQGSLSMLLWILMHLKYLLKIYGKKKSARINLFIISWLLGKIMLTGSLLNKNECA